MNVKEQLRSLGVHPNRRRGQNFLIDKGYAQQIVNFSRLDSDDAILEIGPGLGVLTEILVEVGSKLLVVELESKFCEFLERQIPKLSADEIIQEDILKLDAAQIAGMLGVSKFVVVSNLPYSVSTDVVLWLLKNKKYIKSASLLLQKEYAQRIAAQPGGRKYGSITVLRSLHAEAELGFVIEGSVFHPPVGVSSQMLRLEFNSGLRADVEDEKLFERVLRAAFGQRRKTLANALAAGSLLPTKTLVEDLLRRCEIDPKCRAETLSLEQFALISNKLRTRRH